MPAESPPVIYILQGENEFAISEFLKALSSRLADRAMADLNSTRLDGRMHSLDDLIAAASALHFLAARRLVIFTHPLERVRTPSQHKRLLEILQKVSPSTALVLVIEGHLTEARDRRKGDMHW